MSMRLECPSVQNAYFAISDHFLAGPHEVIQAVFKFIGGLDAIAGVAGEAGPDCEAGHCSNSGSGG